MKIPYILLQTNMNLEKEISNYKAKYNLYTNHYGSRVDLLKELEAMITEYDKHRVQIDESSYRARSKKAISSLINESERKMMKLFPGVIGQKFVNIPVYPSHPASTDFAVVASQALTNIARGANKIKDKILLQSKFLHEIKQCLTDYGLHSNIKKRALGMFTKYMVSITHSHRTEEDLTELKMSLNKASLEKNFTNPYQSKQDVFLNGSKIPFEKIHSFKVAQLNLLDDEVILFKEKNQIETDEELFNFSKDVTDFYANTDTINSGSKLTGAIWELVHPTIKKLVEGRFKAGHYQDAVFVACKKMNNIIKEKYKEETGNDEDGQSLMNKVFSPKSPHFILPTDLSSVSRQNEQRGYMMLFAGTMSAIRNPIGHENIVLTERDAMQKLIFVSHLLEKFEKRSK